MMERMDMFNMVAMVATILFMAVGAYAIVIVILSIRDHVLLKRKHRLENPNLDPLRDYPWWTKIWGLHAIYFAGWARGEEYGFYRGEEMIKALSSVRLEAAENIEEIIKRNEVKLRAETMDYSRPLETIPYYQTAILSDAEQAAIRPNPPSQQKEEPQ